MSVSTTTEPPPYFLQEVAFDEQQYEAVLATTTTPTVTEHKAPLKKKVPANHKEGLFSPAVRLGKKLLGETELNRIRGNAIALLYVDQPVDEE